MTTIKNFGFPPDVLAKKISKFDILPEGPWKAEPDFVFWYDQNNNPLCISRLPFLGTFCGYIGCDKNSYYYKKDYDQIDLETHYGLTYSGFEPALILNNLDLNLQQEFWWLGFDCVHWNDVKPMMEVYFQMQLKSNQQETYRNIFYIKDILENMAKQINSIKELSQDYLDLEFN